jgi:hypothetical protein
MKDIVGGEFTILLPLKRGRLYPTGVPFGLPFGSHAQLETLVNLMQRRRQWVWLCTPFGWKIV